MIALNCLSAHQLDAIQRPYGQAQHGFGHIPRPYGSWSELNVGIQPLVAVYHYHCVTFVLTDSLFGATDYIHYASQQQLAFDVDNHQFALRFVAVVFVMLPVVLVQLAAR